MHAPGLALISCIAYASHVTWMPEGSVHPATAHITFPLQAL